MGTYLHMLGNVVNKEPFGKKGDHRKQGHQIPDSRKKPDSALEFYYYLVGTIY